MNTAIHPKRILLDIVTTLSWRSNDLLHPTVQPVYPTLIDVYPETFELPSHNDYPGDLLCHHFHFKHRLHRRTPSISLFVIIRNKGECYMLLFVIFCLNTSCSSNTSFAALYIWIIYSLQNLNSSYPFQIHHLSIDFLSVLVYSRLVITSRTSHIMKHLHDIVTSLPTCLIRNRIVFGVLWSSSTPPCLSTRKTELKVCYQYFSV